VGRLPGVGDGSQKMSKSLNNAIFLSDTPREVEKKVARITTGRQSPTEPGDPDNVLFKFVEAFIPDQARVAELKDRYRRGDNIGDGHIKQELAAAINALLEPMRARRARYEGPSGDAVIEDIIRTGTRRANATAEETLYLAKKAMKLDFGRRVLG
jgi:tryptophanyl-tRNA synthetase